MTTLPPEVDAAVRARWPQRGAAWSSAVSAELATLCTKLGVTQHGTYPARYAFVVHATSLTGAGLVLRSSPDPDAGHQAAVLRYLADADLAPPLHLVTTTPTATWTIADAVKPGTALRDATPEQRSHVDIVTVLRRLAETRPGPPTAPDLVTWLRSRLVAPSVDDLPPNQGPAPEHERRAAVDALDAMEPPSVARLCHGDLSPGNALIGRGRLWLIDPRGINGEPAYDIAVVALKACDDNPAAARPVAAALARSARADPARAASWVPIAAAARV